MMGQPVLARRLTPEVLMRSHKSLVAISAAAAIGAGAFLLPAAVGSPSRTTHTLRFTAVVQKSKSFSKTSFGQDEIDRKGGKIVGFDVINGTVNPTTHVATGHVAMSSEGGVLYGSLRFPSDRRTTGKVTGGTGIFHGATGTIVGKSNKAGTRTAITVVYTN
jgi:hypothetical protein